MEYGGDIGNLTKYCKTLRPNKKLVVTVYNMLLQGVGIISLPDKHNIQKLLLARSLFSFFVLFPTSDNVISATAPLARSQPITDVQIHSSLSRSFPEQIYLQGF